MRRTSLLLALLAVCAVPGAAAAQECPRTTLADIEDEVMCPVCGTPLGLATEAPQAQRQREFIEELIADCRSKQEVKSALVAEFGEGVLALPGDAAGEDDATDALVYAVPALGIALALGGIAYAALRWRRRPRAPLKGGGSAARAPELDADMERYDL